MAFNFLEQDLVVWVQLGTPNWVDSLTGPGVECGIMDAIKGQGGKRVAVREESKEVMQGKTGREARDELIDLINWTMQSEGKEAV